MTILSRDILTNHGPFIQFADCACCIDTTECEFPHRQKFEQAIFFEMADDLLGLYCSITQSYSPFDPYNFEQLDDPFKVRVLASELLIWSFQIARAKPQIFSNHVMGGSIYDGSQIATQNDELTGEQLRLDLIETLLFLVGAFSRIAQSNRCLVIDGI